MSRGASDNIKISSGCPVTALTRSPFAGDNLQRVCRHRQGSTMPHGLLSERVQAALWPRPAPLAPCGISLAVSAPKLLASETAAARLHGQLTNAAANKLAVALRIADLGSGRDADRRFAAVCVNIALAYRRARLDPRALEITLQAGQVSPQSAWRLRQASLGRGPLNILLDDVTMSAAGRTQSAESECLWRQLWQLRSTPVIAAFWPSVSSRCALLSSEVATDIIPNLGLQAPTESAWLHCEFDLTKFVNDSGRFDKVAITRALIACVENAERMHELFVWPTPAMQQDAWFNRRIAIRIAGIGDVATRFRLDPKRHSSVVVLDRLLLHIRQVVDRHAHEMARSRETLPAIEAANPCRQLGPGHTREAWTRRWSRALECSATRCRNLIVMSPWSVFPRDNADLRYANFLPLLAHADACEFRRPPSLSRWNVSDFIQFHRRASALRQNVESARVVAERL
jgi:hypothetical protein